MGISEVEQALAIVRAHPNRVRFVGPRDERLIAAAETALGISFPPTYRRFLLELGAGNISGAEICGVIDDDFEHSSVPDVVWLTLDERISSKLPTSMVAIYSGEDGAYYVLDTSQSDRERECPVVAWIPGFSQPGSELDVVASDFGSFLLTLAQEALGTT